MRALLVAREAIGETRLGLRERSDGLVVLHEDQTKGPSEPLSRIPIVLRLVRKAHLLSDPSSRSPAGVALGRSLWIDPTSRPTVSEGVEVPDEVLGLLLGHIEDVLVTLADSAVLGLGELDLLADLGGLDPRAPGFAADGDPLASISTS
jgi:hypothetical protein